jgi:endonuclease/exonuclease/phosphatase family metal-dependent hydrolase
MISKTDADGNPTIILGDFNFDLLSDTCNTRFKNLLATFNLVPLITVPTRPVSRSLLDHFYVSQKDNISTSAFEQTSADVLFRAPFIRS